MKSCDHFPSMTGHPTLNSKLRKHFETVSMARVRNEDFFWATHSRITLMKLNRGKTDGARTVGEEDVLDLILQDRDGNHTSIIFGKPGIGKSELCAYLFLKLKESVDEDAILYLDRAQSQNDILKTVAGRYQRVAGKPLPGNDLTIIDKVMSTPNNWAHAFFAKMVSNLEGVLGPEIGRAFDSDKDATGEFASYISSRLEKILRTPVNRDAPKDQNFLELGALERGPNQVWASRFRENSGGVPIERLHGLINDAFDDAFRDITGTVDLKTALQQFADAIGGRVYVIFEDFNFSSTQEKEIANFMESTGEASYSCEFIVAGTRDNLRTLETQTGLERHDFYKLEGDDEGCTFIRPETAGDFMASYMSYWKEKINKCACGVCSSIEKTCGSKEAVLFPFNEAFIRNAYKNLRNQSPRNLINMAFELIVDYSEGVPPSNSRSLLRFARTPCVSSFNADNKLESLVAWYGEVHDGHLRLRALYSELFGIQVSSDTVTCDDSYLVLTSEAREGLSEIGEEEPEGPNDVNDIANWRAFPSEYPDPGVFITLGAKEVLHYLSDNWRITQDRAERNGPPIYYDYQTAEAVSFETHARRDMNLEPGVFSVYELRDLHIVGRQLRSVLDVLPQLSSTIVKELDMWRRAKWKTLQDIPVGTYGYTLHRLIVDCALFATVIRYPFLSLNSSSLTLAYHVDRAAGEEEEEASGPAGDVCLFDISGLLDPDDDYLPETQTKLDEISAFMKEILASQTAIFYFFEGLCTRDGIVVDTPGLDCSQDPLEAIGKANPRWIRQSIDGRYKVATGSGEQRPVNKMMDAFLKNVKGISTELDDCPSLEDDREGASQIVAWIDEVSSNRDRFNELLGRMRHIKALSELSEVLDGFGTECRARDLKESRQMLTIYAEDEVPPWLQAIRGEVLARRGVYRCGRDLLRSGLFENSQAGSGSGNKRKKELLGGVIEVLAHV